jgi:hypothetical protein
VCSSDLKPNIQQNHQKRREAFREALNGFVFYYIINQTQQSKIKYHIRQNYDDIVISRGIGDMNRQK